MADEAYFAQPGAAVLKAFNVTVEQGLSEARVEEQRKKYGRNEMPQPDKTPLWKLILEQFEDTLVRILLGAAVISFTLAVFDEGDDQVQAFVEPFVILLILFANATVGVVQETNAEKAIEALKEYSADEAKVYRDGSLQRIKATELVPGDVIDIATGDKIPADARLLSFQSTTLRVDEAILTGESAAKFKQVEPVADRGASIQGKVSLVFGGTKVTVGKAKAVVVATGHQSEIGKIFLAIQEDDDQVTPLKKKLDEFGETLSKVIGVICVLVWLINIGHFNDEAFDGNYLKGAVYYFKIAVALAVAAIPEGLPAVITTCLALGTMKMAKKNAIVRSLPSVETLGATTVICSDKTGTLTTNKMSVSRFMVFDAGRKPVEYDVDGLSFAPTGDVKVGDKTVPVPSAEPVIAELAKVCVLCNEAKLVFNATSKQYELVGEPTEGSLRVLAEKLKTGVSAVDTTLDGLAPAKRADAVATHFESGVEKLAVLEFSRDRKSMSVLIKDKATKGNRLLVKGQPDSILQRCTSAMTAGGQVVALSGAQLADFQAHVRRTFESWGSGANTLRCMALAVVNNARDLKDYDFKDEKAFRTYESPLTFIGLVGMLDPPRLEVKSSIERCEQAGIRVIVITGDHKNTAEGICRRIGVFGENESTEGKSYTGAEYDALSAADKKAAVHRAKLFCQTEPRHKADLVALLQEENHVVAMTGDGVNDAPALKKADIGVAMGSGTAVAKEASDMVLADDNFATIVSAVEEGRAIFNNTKQFIRYLISSNIGEVVCIFLTVVLGTPEALIPVQLLWVNLVTDGLPATALGFNPPDLDIMERPPRKADESIVNGWLFFRYIVVGAYVGVATVFGYIWWFVYYHGGPMITFDQLRHFHDCESLYANVLDCGMFSGDMAQRASTMSLSILVTIEMFNAFNSLSENQSLFAMPPWINKYLVLACSLSMVLHFAILYIPFLAEMFSIEPLNSDEWIAVVAISAPVLLIDEILKLASRILQGSPTRKHKKD